jgi:hypothetical protein
VKYAKELRFPNWLIASNESGVVEQMIDLAARDALYEAVRATPGEYKVVREQVSQHKDPQQFYDDCTVLRVEVDVDPVQAQRVAVPVFEEIRIPAGKVRCYWCGSHAPDDKFGNCSACGGPR